MPIFVRTKNPPLSLVSKGELDRKTMKKFRREIGRFLTLTDYQQDKLMYVPTSQESNIVYFTTITPDQFKAMEEDKKKTEEQQTQGRIVRPEFKGYVPPGRGKRHR